MSEVKQSYTNSLQLQLLQAREQLKTAQELAEEAIKNYNVQLTKNGELREALEYANKACLCTRSTKGFDYHETHPQMGKAKDGSRWLTPSAYIKQALNKEV